MHGVFDSDGWLDRLGLLFSGSLPRDSTLTREFAILQSRPSGRRAIAQGLNSSEGPSASTVSRTIDHARDCQTGNLEQIVVMG